MDRLIDLPDRDEITLCEAVTAFVCGKAYNLRQWQCMVDAVDARTERNFAVTALERPPPARLLTEEQVTRRDELLPRLQEAAYAGRIKFRALREGDDPANGYTTIDPRYFYVRPHFHWSQDTILHQNNDASIPWYFVHLDREGFAALVQEIGASVPIYKTGAPGRPTSKHLVEQEAKRRLDAGEIPKTLAEFSRQLAEWHRTTHPSAPQMVAHTIENSIRGMWNSHPK
jgi:hypothetical protein